MGALLLLLVFLGGLQHVWGLVACRSTRRISTCMDLCDVPPGVESCTSSVMYFVGRACRSQLRYVRSRIIIVNQQ